MKYKAGDKVKIRTWEEMKQESGMNSDGDIRGDLYFFCKSREKEINECCPDRVLTIKNIMYKDYSKYEYYEMRELSFEWRWLDGMIECLAKDYKAPIPSIPILTRFEILDL